MSGSARRVIVFRGLCPYETKGFRQVEVRICQGGTKLNI